MDNEKEWKPKTEFTWSLTFTVLFLGFAIGFLACHKLYTAV